MTLTGDMAVRVYWGDDANFLLSVGGFHPPTEPPPAMGLGDMRRLAIIISQPQPLIRAEVYFAVTSNTVQFGAKVELMAGASIFNVYGFLSLDALIQFDPFQFIVEIAGMLAVRSGSSVLFAVRLELTLSGPSPRHAGGARRPSRSGSSSPSPSASASRSRSASGATRRCRRSGSSTCSCRRSMRTPPGGSCRPPSTATR